MLCGSTEKAGLGRAALWRGLAFRGFGQTAARLELTVVSDTAAESQIGGRKAVSEGIHTLTLWTCDIRPENQDIFA